MVDLLTSLSSLSRPSPTEILWRPTAWIGPPPPSPPPRREGETLTLDFGNATTDGTSYYMLMNGQESPVYIISGTLYDYLSLRPSTTCATCRSCRC